MIHVWKAGLVLFFCFFSVDFIVVYRWHCFFFSFFLSGSLAGTYDDSDTSSFVGVGFGARAGLFMEAGMRTHGGERNTDM